jgi:hypothetical protein
MSTSHNRGASGGLAGASNTLKSNQPTANSINPPRTQKFGHSRLPRSDAELTLLCHRDREI